MKKILITCPPMAQNSSNYKLYANKKGFDLKIIKSKQILNSSEIINHLKNCSGWIVGDDLVSLEVLKKAKNLKAFVKWGVGIDNVDIKAAKKMGIPWDFTPKMFGNEVAEVAISYCLNLAKKTHLIDKEVKKGNWKKIQGESLFNKTIGIVGLGDIGKNIAKRIKPFGAKIISWDPKIIKNQYCERIIKKWPQEISICDYLIFSCDLNKNTHHMFNKSILKKIKPGLKVVNVSRGSLIDEKAIIKGLKDGIIDSVALDVFEREPASKSNVLLKYENCVYGSHNASNSKEAVDRTNLLALKKLFKLLKDD